jgi:recombination protein RecA
MVHDSILNELVKIGISAQTEYPTVPRISTGSLAMDYATGGYPRGRWSVLWGEEQAGKSTMFFVAAAALHRRDPNAIVGYIDTEHATDYDWVQRLGVDLDRFVIVYADNTEMALNALRYMITGAKVSGKSGRKQVIRRMFSLIGLDSICAVEPSSAVQGDIGDLSVGLQAKLIHDFFKRTTPELASATIIKGDLSTGEVLGEEPPPAIVITNQVREYIGRTHGPTEYMPGGRGMRHAPSLVIRLYKPNQSHVLQDGDNVKGVLHRGKIIKNKVGPPLREFETLVRQDAGWSDNGVDGIDVLADVAEACFKLNVFTNKDGLPWKGGGLYFGGVLLDIPKAPAKVKEKKTQWGVQQFLYEQDPDGVWYERLYTAALESIKASVIGEKPPVFEIDQLDDDVAYDIEVAQIEAEINLGDALMSISSDKGA